MRQHDWLKCSARASSDVGFSLAEQAGALHLSRRCGSEGRLSVCQLCLATQSKSYTGLKRWTNIGEFQEGLWWCGPHRFQLNDNGDFLWRNERNLRSLDICMRQREGELRYVIMYPHSHSFVRPNQFIIILLVLWSFYFFLQFLKRIADFSF